jgi:hypothetical protein
MYDAFNRRDIDAVLAAMTPEVDWANGWEGGRVIGREAVRAYWTRQWDAVDSRADPISIRPRSEHELEVTVHVTGRDAAGELVFDDKVRHVYAFRGDLVERMSIEPLIP